MIATTDCVIRWTRDHDGIATLHGHPLLIEFANPVVIADVIDKVLTLDAPYRVFCVPHQPIQNVPKERRTDAECFDLDNPEARFSWEITQHWARAYLHDDKAIETHNRLLTLMAQDGWITDAATGGQDG